MIKEKSPRTEQGRATTMKVPITYLQIVLLQLVVFHHGTLFFEKMTLVRLFKLYSPPI